MARAAITRRTKIPATAKRIPSLRRLHIITIVVTTTRKKKAGAKIRKKKNCQKKSKNLSMTS